MTGQMSRFVAYLSSVEVYAGKEAAVIAVSNLVVHQRDNLCYRGEDDITDQIYISLEKFMTILAHP